MNILKGSAVSQELGYHRAERLAVLGLAARDEARGRAVKAITGGLNMRLQPDRSSDRISPLGMLLQASRAEYDVVPPTRKHRDGDGQSGSSAGAARAMQVEHLRQAMAGRPRRRRMMQRRGEADAGAASWVGVWKNTLAHITEGVRSAWRSLGAAGSWVRYFVSMEWVRGSGSRRRRSGKGHGGSLAGRGIESSNASHLLLRIGPDRQNALQLARSIVAMIRACESESELQIGDTEESGSSERLFTRDPRCRHVTPAVTRLLQAGLPELLLLHELVESVLEAQPLRPKRSGESQLDTRSRNGGSSG